MAEWVDMEKPTVAQPYPHPVVKSLGGWVLGPRGWQNVLGGPLPQVWAHDLGVPPSRCPCPDCRAEGEAQDRAVAQLSQALDAADGAALERVLDEVLQLTPVPMAPESIAAPCSSSPPSSAPPSSAPKAPSPQAALWAHTMQSEAGRTHTAGWQAQHRAGPCAAPDCPARLRQWAAGRASPLVRTRTAPAPLNRYVHTTTRAAAR